MAYYKVPAINNIPSSHIVNYSSAHYVSPTEIYIETNEDQQSDWTKITEEQWGKVSIGFSINTDPLVVAKSQKLQELQEASDRATETFKSSALGSSHTYLADEKSMTYLNAQYSFVNGTHYDNSLSKWYTVESGFVDHTADQITQVFLDGRAYINEQKTVKLASLLVQVQTASTVGEVNAIVW